MIQVTRQGRGPRMLGMMGVILGCAIAFGTIKSPSSFGAQAVVVCTIATLLVATFGAILCTPKAFWFGLAAVGWASMLLASGFWFDPIEGEPNILGAAIFYRYYPEEFAKFLGRFPSGPLQYRAIVFSQIALVQGLIGGSAAFLLKRERKSIISNPDDRLPVKLWGTLAIVLTYLALRFCETIGTIVYIQVVTILLVATTIGVFVGRHRSACAGAALLGWATLLWHAYWPDVNSKGIAGNLYEALYVRLGLSDGFAITRPGSWGVWRSWLVGDSAGLRMAGFIGNRWGLRRLDHHHLFMIVACHAAALFNMGLGAAVGTWLARRSRKAVAP